MVPRPDDGDVLRLVPTAMAAGGAAVARETHGPGGAGRWSLARGNSRRCAHRGTLQLRPRPRSPRSSSPHPIELPRRAHMSPGAAGAAAGSTFPWRPSAATRQRSSRRPWGASAASGGPKSSLPAPASLAGYRTTLRLTLDGARPGFRRHRGHEVVPVDSCLVAHPLLAELLAVGDFGEATEVTLRCGARTGERLAVVGPSCGGASLPGSVRVIGEDELAAGRRAWIFEVVAGQTPAALGAVVLPGEPRRGGGPGQPCRLGSRGSARRATGRCLRRRRPLRCDRWREPSGDAPGVLGAGRGGCQGQPSGCDGPPHRRRQMAGLKGGGRGGGPPDGPALALPGWPLWLRAGQAIWRWSRATRPPLDGTLPCCGLEASVWNGQRSLTCSPARLTSKWSAASSVRAPPVLVAVVSRLVGAFYGHADVGGLVLR